MRSASLWLVLASLTLCACGHKGDASGSGAASSGTAAAPAPPAEPTLTVTAKAPAVGDKEEVKGVADMDLALSMKLGAKAKEFNVHMIETTVKQTEVLAVDGKAVTKAKVTFVEKKKTEVDDGKERKKPKSPIEGKTYVLEMKDGKLLITNDKGKKPSKREEDLVRKDAGGFGKPDPIAAAMPDKPIKVGDKVDALGAALGEFIKDQDDGKEPPVVSDVEVKLTSIEGTGPDAVGVFSVKFTMATQENKNNPFALKAPLTGTMKIRAKDGNPSDLRMTGPIELATKKGDMSGKGTMKLERTATY